MIVEIGKRYYLSQVCRFINETMERYYRTRFEQDKNYVFVDDMEGGIPDDYLDLCQPGIPDFHENTCYKVAYIIRQIDEECFEKSIVQVIAIIDYDYYLNVLGIGTRNKTS